MIPDRSRWSSSRRHRDVTLAGLPWQITIICAIRTTSSSCRLRRLILRSDSRAARRVPRRNRPDRHRPYGQARWYPVLSVCKSRECGKASAVVLLAYTHGERSRGTFQAHWCGVGALRRGRRDGAQLDCQVPGAYHRSALPGWALVRASAEATSARARPGRIWARRPPDPEPRLTERHHDRPDSATGGQAGFDRPTSRCQCVDRPARRRGRAGG